MIKKNDRLFIVIFILYLKNCIFMGNLIDYIIIKCIIFYLYKICIYMLSRVLDIIK